MKKCRCRSVTCTAEWDLDAEKGPSCPRLMCPLKTDWESARSSGMFLSNSNGNLKRPSASGSQPDPKKLVTPSIAPSQKAPFRIKGMEIPSTMKSSDLETSQAASALPIKIQNDSKANISKFLCDSFQPVMDSEYLKDTKSKRMDQYAELALFLSDPVQFRKAAIELSLLLEDTYTNFKKQGLRGAFSMVLSQVAKDFGFSRDVLILNGQIEDESFATVLAGRFLFRDVYTRPHGEFSHAVQWLVMGIRFGKAVAELYEHSVNYKSKKHFKTQKGNSAPIYLWNFLVDCFVEKENGPEDYKTNICADTFRCPQYTTWNLDDRLTTKSWLGNFIYARGKKGLRGGSKVPEGSHYFQTEGKWTVIMEKKHVERKIWIENAYEVLAQDQKGAILKKRLREYQMD